MRLFIHDIRCGGSPGRVMSLLSVTVSEVKPVILNKKYLKTAMAWHGVASSLRSAHILVRPK